MAPATDFEQPEFAPDPTLDPLAGATGGKRLSGGTMIIVAVVLIAIGGLYSMKVLSHATAAATLDEQTETLVEDFIAQFGRGVRPAPGDEFVNLSPEAGVADVLNEDRTEKQVPLEELQKNPLVIWNEGAAPVEGPKTKDRVSDLIAACTKQRAELDQLCKRLRLKSILGGARPMALLEDKIVRIGDSFTAGASGIKLRIDAIESDHIMVSAKAPLCDPSALDTSALTPEQITRLESELTALPDMSFRVDLKREGA